MRKAHILLASVLLISSLTVQISPMMAAVTLSSDSPQSYIEINDRDKDDLDITAFAGVITDGRDFLNISRGHASIPYQPSSKSIVSVPSVAKLASLHMDSGALAQKLVGGKSVLSVPSAADILLSNRQLITDGMDIAQDSSPLVRSVGSVRITTSNNNSSIHSTASAPQNNNRGSAVNAVVPNSKDILYVIKALEDAGETVSFNPAQS